MKFPAGITTGTTTRQVLVNDFNIVRPESYPKLISKYGDENYTLTQQGLGRMKITSMLSENKMFFHYERRSKNHFAVTSTAAVAGALGAAITVPIGANDIFDGKSPLRVNEQVQNAYTGVYSTIISINTATPGAYTMTLQPIQSFTNASCNAGDTFLFRGILDIGGQSTRQQTQDTLTDKVTNYLTEIRDDYTLDDLALKERIDFSVPGSDVRYYKFKAMDDLTRRFNNYVDWKLMLAPQGDQLLNNATGSEGVFPRIQRDGGTISYGGAFSATNTLAQIGRYVDAEGGSDEYDWLYDTEQSIALANAIGSEFNNGAIIYDQNASGGAIDLRRNFKSLNLFNRKFNFYKYKGFNQAAVYGVPNEGTYYSNTGLLIPQDSMPDAKTGEMTPSFTVRYSGGPQGGDDEIKSWSTGAFADNGNQTDVAELSAHFLAYKGVEVFAANRYLIVQS